jgi:hypothetical protein
MPSPAEHDTADSKADLRLDGGQHFVPAFVFLGLCLFLTPLMGRIIVETRTFPVLITTMWSGILFGQMVLLNLIGGLGGRHWVIGFSASFGLGSLGFFVFCLFFFDWEPLFFQAFLTIACLPLTLGIACLPQLALRLFRNWRISLTDRPKSAIRIEDFMIAMAVLGCAIALVRASSYAAQPADMPIDTEIMIYGVTWYCFYLGAIFFVVNLISLPAFLLGFRPEPFILRSIGVGGYVFFWSLFLGVLAAFFRGDGLIVALYSLIFLMAASAVVLLGIECSRRAGFNLWSIRDDRLWTCSLGYRNSPSNSRVNVDEGLATWAGDKTEVIDPFSDETDANAQSRQRTSIRSLEPEHLFARWLTFGWVLIAVLFNVFSGF